MDESVGFLKRHGFVVAAVALPLLVVVAFALSHAVPRWLVDDPRYELVFSAVASYSSTPGDRQCEISTVDGHVRVRWRRTEEPVYGSTLRVYRVDPATGALRELGVPEAGELGAPGDTQDLVLPGLEDVRLDTAPRAPDGYEYEYTYPRGSGLFGELFYRGSRGPRATIHKSGRVIALPRTGQDPYGYDSLTFLGWAVPLGERPAGER